MSEAECCFCRRSLSKSWEVRHGWCDACEGDCPVAADSAAHVIMLARKLAAERLELVNHQKEVIRLLHEATIVLRQGVLGLKPNAEAYREATKLLDQVCFLNADQTRRGS